MTASLSTRMLGYRHWFLTYPRLWHLPTRLYSLD
jgi:hypothetical protein